MWKCDVGTYEFGQDAEVRSVFLHLVIDFIEDGRARWNTNIPYLNPHAGINRLLLCGSSVGVLDLLIHWVGVFQDLQGCSGQKYQSRMVGGRMNPAFSERL